MQIKIQRVVRTLNLYEFEPEYGSEFIEIWVNPTSLLTDKWIDLVENASALRKEISQMISVQADAEKMRPVLGGLEVISNQIIEWLAEIWSQGAVDTHWSVEDVRALINECTEKDMALYEWLVRRTSEMIRDYRLEKKKA
jgi:hypothetical protein